MNRALFIKARYAALLLSIASTRVADAQAFNRLISIGDSLSDVGNINALSGGAYPGPAYYNGRYSNGPLWIEGVASGLALPAPTPSRQTGGLDYATGGSESGSGNTSFILPNAGTQTNSFLTAHPPTSNDLVTLWTGANDFLDGQTNPSVPAENIRIAAARLAAAGVKNLVVPNLPLLGETPQYRNTADRAALNLRTQQFNAALSTKLDSVAAAYDINLFRIDVAGFFADALANPAAHGFTNVTDPALRSDNTVVANPDDYLFWDNIHPTRIGHAQLGTIAFEAVTQRRWTAGAGDYALATNWSTKRVPDATSAVAIPSAGDVTLASNAVVRTLDLGGTLAIALNPATTTPRLRATATAAINGNVRVSFVAGFVGLPGQTFSLVSAAGVTGAPTLSNATGYAGLQLTPIVTATSVAVSLSATPGDADLNATIDFADLLTVAQHYDATSGQTWLTGDFTNDGAVSFDDLLALSQHYGGGTLTSDAFALAGVDPAFASEWALAQSLVPEPASALVALSCVTLARRRRR